MWTIVSPCFDPARPNELLSNALLSNELLSSTTV